MTRLTSVRPKKAPETDSDGNPVWARNADGIQVCGAKIPKTDPPRYCQSTVIVHPTGRCRMHGGVSKRGVEHGNAVHLRRSSSLPTHLQPAMEAALNDPTLLQLNYEIALDDIAIQNLTTALGDSTQPHTHPEGYPLQALQYFHTTLSELDALYVTYEVTQDPTLLPRIHELTSALLRATRSMKNEREIHREIREVSDHRRKLVEAEQKHRIQLKMMIDASQAFNLAAGMVGVAQDAMKELCQQILLEFTLLSRDPRTLNQQATFIPASIQEAFQRRLAIGLGRLVGPKGNPISVPSPENMAANGMMSISDTTTLPALSSGDEEEFTEEDYLDE